MKPERFGQIRELFDKALALDPQDRESFLDEACADDPELRQELATLLASHGKEDDFLETSILGKEPDGLEIGQLVGPYRIEAEIGRGGMGVVYRAEDTRLHRQVALKALPPAFLIDPKQRERFRREARVTASLSHPALATVYALEELEGHLYIAAELVQGDNLRAKLRDGPLPLPVLIDVAVQAARGLAAAHAKGIVHRDLKPENLALNQHGNLKILDFGLALLTEVERTRERLTEDGALLGTPAYMSPEQFEGDDVDFRCDIFAFGIVLYELASGSNPFQGKTPFSTIGRTLGVDPEPIPQLLRQAPALDAIIQKCLRKKLEDRYQSTEDLVKQLEALQSGRSSLLSDGEGPSEVILDTATDARSLHGSWWVVHQTVVMVLYGLMVIVVWDMWDWTPGGWTLALLFGVLGCTVVNGTLRTHLLFTYRFNRPAIAAEIQRATPWLRRFDWLFVSLLMAVAVAISIERRILAGFLAAVSLGYGSVFLFVETATVRSVFAKEFDANK